MPNVTENYGLKKPFVDEFYDINVHNENMDVIDAKLKELSSFTPDVSGEINAHNTSGTSHSDIRTAVSEAKQSASQALIDAKSYVDAKVAAIPAPKLTAEEIGALPIEGGSVTGTELGINNNRGKMVANGNMFRVYTTEDPSDTQNQRYLNFYSQYFKEDVSESLKLTERINGVDHAYQIYGEHNITSGTTDLTAGTSELPSGHIYFVYE